MPLYIAKSGDLEGCHACLTHSLTDSHLKDSATQLLIKFKTGALVTQSYTKVFFYYHISDGFYCHISDGFEKCHYLLSD